MPTTPIFEQTTSTLYYSNDGRLRLERGDENGTPAFSLRYDDRLGPDDGTFEGEEVFRTLNQVLADAYIAGYDLARR